MIDSTAWPGHFLRGATPTHELLAGGVRRRELERRPGGWVPYAQGLWAPSWQPADDPDVRIARAAELVPKDGSGGALGGWAAARLHGDPFADGYTSDGRRLPVLLCVPRQGSCRRTAKGDVRVFHSDLADDEIVWAGDVPITSLVRTAADLARREPLREAVAAIDSLRQHAEVDVLAVAQWCRDHPVRHGVAAALEVLALSRPGVKSPQETGARLLWVLDAGLREPLVNATILHGEGLVLAEADLLDPSTGLVCEFDGAVHAGAGQRALDQARRDDMRRASLVVVVLGAGDLTAYRKRSVERLRRGYAEALDIEPRTRSWYLPAA